MGKWHRKNLGTICHLAYGKNLPTTLFTSEGFKVFGANSIIGYYSKYTHEDAEVLVSCRGEYSGVINFSEPKSYITNNSIVCILKLDLDKRFLFYALKNIPRQTFVSGSAQPQVVIQDLENIELYYPESKPEQTRIAQILSTIDRAIAQTEALIAKCQRIKTGLMQDLLTRGIDEHGRIRSKATHRFVVKNGIEVPEEWEVVELENITELITKGESPNWQGYKYQDEGVLFVTSENVRDGYIDIETNKKFIPDLFHNKLKRSQLKKGDILINLVGASIARSALFDIEAEANINQAVSSIRLKSRVNKYWFAEYLCFPINIQRLLGEQVETARANLSLGDLRKFFVAIPNEHEQNKIALKLQYMANIIVRHRLKLSKLQSLKTGLMQDLLSGRVRVKLPETEHEKEQQNA